MTSLTRKISITALLLGAVAFASVSATAKPKGERGAKRLDRIFQKFDKNSDGKLTESEVPASKWQRVLKADANDDDAVTKDELRAKAKALGKGKRGKKAKRNRRGKHAEGDRKGKRAQRGQRANKRFERLDKNHDGKLTSSEVPAKKWQRIVKADANSDGAVTKEELRSKLQGRRQQRMERKFDQADKNNDGKLTSDEVPAKRWQRISRADSNQDDAVSKEELKTHRGQRSQRRNQRRQRKD